MDNYLTLVLDLHPSCNQSKIDILQDIIERDKLAKKYIHSQLKCKMRLPNTSQMDLMFWPTKDRKKVKYNMKDQFTIMAREYQEIRDNALELLKSIRALGNNVNSFNGVSTRRMRHQRLKPDGTYTAASSRMIVDPTNVLTNLWLMIYNPFNKKKHLKVPIQENRYIDEFFKKYQVDFNSVKTVTVIKKKNGKFTANLTFNEVSKRNLTVPHARVTTHLGKSTTLQQLDTLVPVAGDDNKVLLGLDPGLRIPYTGCFVTSDFKLKYDAVRYYSIPFYQRKIDIVDKAITKLQQNLANMREANKVLQNPDYYNRVANINHKLTKIRIKRRLVRQQAEIELVKLIYQEVKLWENKGWDIEIIVGYPHSVNKFSSRKRVRSRRLRRQSSRWNYKSRPEIMQKVFASFGMDNVYPISENYTSKTCWKCGTTEFRKFRGSKRQQLFKKWGKIYRSGGYFECNNTFCRWSGNADLNGAINIAKRYILTALHKPSENVLKQHRKRKSWHLAHQRALSNQMKRNKSSNDKLQKYKPKTITWEKLQKQKGRNNLYWCEYPTDHLKSFKWIRTRPHAKVPEYAELYDNSVLCPPVFMK